MSKFSFVLTYTYNFTLHFWGQTFNLVISFLGIFVCLFAFVCVLPFHFFYQAFFQDGIMFIFLQLHIWKILLLYVQTASSTVAQYNNAMPFSGFNNLMQLEQCSSV